MHTNFTSCYCSRLIPSYYKQSCDYTKENVNFLSTNRVEIKQRDKFSNIVNHAISALAGAGGLAHLLSLETFKNQVSCKHFTACTSSIGKILLSQGLATFAITHVIMGIREYSSPSLEVKLENLSLFSGLIINTEEEIEILNQTKMYHRFHSYNPLRTQAERNQHQKTADALSAQQKAFNDASAQFIKTSSTIGKLEQDRCNLFLQAIKEKAIKKGCKPSDVWLLSGPRIFGFNLPGCDVPSKELQTTKKNLDSALTELDKNVKTLKQVTQDLSTTVRNSLKK